VARRADEEGSLALKESQKQSNRFRLDDRVAVVTGAASGIGRAIALRFALEGAVVRIVDIDEKAANEAVVEITGSGGNATAHVCDVSNQQCVTEMFQELASKKPINILVNSAGISHIGLARRPFSPFPAGAGTTKTRAAKNNTISVRIFFIGLSLRTGLDERILQKFG